MRWGTYRSPADDTERVGLLVDGRLHGLGAGRALVDLIAGGPGPLEEAAAEARSAPAEVVEPTSVELLAPIPRPPSVRDFMAFENHYVDTRRALDLEVEPVFYEQPCFYFSNPAAIVGPRTDVRSAPGTAQFDFELEIGVVIGRPGSDLALAEAEPHIAGYTILCDWSARDLQAKEGPFGTGPAKGKDTATSLGPWLVTPEELEPFRAERGFDLAMTASVNGEPYSAGKWSSIYWTIPQLLVFASRGTELRSGDVIGTGTVGTGSILELSAVHGAERYPWLAAGDEVRLSVAHLGAVEATVLPAAPLRPLA
ncbi:MAG: fumarylacetoacetate hydrolase family protein [Actinobacteria bacterium]|nr:fumarylacetoacetate hydrolase family protein [Actinomycetota bacterium]